jgi:hypothetical protein
MRRRQGLASGAALLSVPLAGCGHPPVVLDMNDPTPERVATELSIDVDVDSDVYPVVSEALGGGNGSATRTGRYELFDRRDTVRYNGSVYEVSETRLESSEVTVYEVLVDVNPEDTTPEVGAIDYGELPETDRERLAPVVTGEGPPERERYDVGISYGTAEEVGNGSVFVPERSYDIVVHEGSRYRVAVDSRTAPDYRYDLTEVATSLEAFLDRVRERYRFDLAGPGPSGRSSRRRPTAGTTRTTTPSGR